jgi:hypothetical protein
VPGGRFRAVLRYSLAGVEPELARDTAQWRKDLILGMIKPSLGMVTAIALAVAGFSAGSASAATQPTPQAEVAWQAAIAQVPEPGSGCYHASYPALAWHAVTCVAAPNVPFIPAPPSASARHAGPETVGDLHDYSAQVPGLISQATGTFKHVSAGITVKGQVLGSASMVANGFSLQLNSQNVTGSPACSGSSDPSGCIAWQQFLYAYDAGSALTGGNPGSSYIFMQYWLISYGYTCPSGWASDGEGDCYVNSKAAEVNAVTAGQLATLQFSGTAKSGGNDGVSLSVGSGQATMVTASDSRIDLAKHWNTTEWGLFGDGDGDEAYFGANTSLEPQTALTASSGSSAPKCIYAGTTGETNNLELTTTPKLGSQSSPTMATKQTNGTSRTPSCAVAS